MASSLQRLLRSGPRVRPGSMSQVPHVSASPVRPISGCRPISRSGVSSRPQIASQRGRCPCLVSAWQRLPNGPGEGGSSPAQRTGRVHVPAGMHAAPAAFTTTTLMGPTAATPSSLCCPPSLHHRCRHHAAPFTPSPVVGIPSGSAAGPPATPAVTTAPLRCSRPRYAGGARPTGASPPPLLKSARARSFVPALLILLPPPSGLRPVPCA